MSMPNLAGHKITWSSGIYPDQKRHVGTVLADERNEIPTEDDDFMHDKLVVAEDIGTGVFPCIIVSVKGAALVK